MNSSPEKKAAWNVRLLHTLWELDFLPEEPTEVKGVSAAAKSNLFFALSGMCYFFLYVRWGVDSALIWYAMVVALFFLSCLVPAIHRGIRLPRLGKAMALLNAMGAMGAGVRVAMDFFAEAYGTVQIAEMLGLSSKLVAVGISNARRL